MQYVWKTLAASILFSSAGAALAQQGETVKIAWLDPLSGLMAALEIGRASCRERV